MPAKKKASRTNKQARSAFEQMSLSDMRKTRRLMKSGGLSMAQAAQRVAGKPGDFVTPNAMGDLSDRMLGRKKRSSRSLKPGTSVKNSRKKKTTKRKK